MLAMRVQQVLPYWPKCWTRARRVIPFLHQYANNSSSSQRRRGPSDFQQQPQRHWIPAFAGMTEKMQLSKWKWNESSDALDTLRWVTEEWRVSGFAQELKTAEPVSGKRMVQALAALNATRRRIIAVPECRKTLHISEFWRCGSKELPIKSITLLYGAILA